MVTQRGERDGDGSYRNQLTVNRRHVLYGIGAGAMLTGLGTGVGAAEGADPDTASMHDVSGDDVHPVFGFSALSPEIDPPVSPDHEVEALIRPREDRPIPEFFFEPTGLAIEPGETVRFTLTTPHHSVTAFHPAMGIAQRVPDNVPPFSSPVLPVQAYWLYTFEEEGVYDYHCGPHEVFGHVGRVVAGEAVGPGAEPVPAPDEEPAHDVDGEGPPVRQPVGTAAPVLNDPALEPARIIEHGTVSWDDLQPESKELLL